MAAIINGAPIVEQVYEFGYETKDGTYLAPDYDSAKSACDQYGDNLKMRVVYKTDWMEAR